MFDKITTRVGKLCYGLDSDFVEPVSERGVDWRIDVCSIV